MATTAVTAPLERQFGEMAWAQSDELNQLGGSGGVTTLQFSLDLSLAMSPRKKCRRRSTRRAGLLPAGLPAPPVYAKVNPGGRARLDAARGHVENLAAHSA